MSQKSRILGLHGMDPTPASITMNHTIRFIRNVVLAAASWTAGIVVAIASLWFAAKILSSCYGLE